MNHTLFALIKAQRPLSLDELVERVNRPAFYIMAEIRKENEAIRKCSDGRYVAKTAREFFARENGVGQ